MTTTTPIFTFTHSHTWPRIWSYIYPTWCHTMTPQRLLACLAKSRITSLVMTSSWTWTQPSQVIVYIIRSTRRSEKIEKESFESDQKIETAKSEIRRQHQLWGRIRTTQKEIHSTPRTILLVPLNAEIPLITQMQGDDRGHRPIHIGNAQVNQILWTKRTMKFRGGISYRDTYPTPHHDRKFVASEQNKIYARQ